MRQAAAAREVHARSRGAPTHDAGAPTHDDERTSVECEGAPDAAARSTAGRSRSACAAGGAGSGRAARGCRCRAGQQLGPGSAAAATTHARTTRVRRRARAHGVVRGGARSEYCATAWRTGAAAARGGGAACELQVPELTPPRR